jgi:hypothetical protein
VIHLGLRAGRSDRQVRLVNASRLDAEHKARNAVQTRVRTMIDMDDPLNRQPPTACEPGDSQKGKSP